MSKTLLNGVNDVLKRVGVIKGNSGELTSLTDSQRQTLVDMTVQMWNEALTDMVEVAGNMLPKAVASGTVTLATSTRAYALATDLVRLRWPLHDVTNGTYIDEYPGGYEQLYADQPIPANVTGLPTLGAIRPTDGFMYVNTTPTANENGRAYTYYYDKSLLLAAAGDLFPFSDSVYAMMISPVAELLKRETEKKFDQQLYTRRMAQAVSLATEDERQAQWTPERTGYARNSDPLEP